jgi:hypothetical protein
MGNVVADGRFFCRPISLLELLMIEREGVSAAELWLSRAAPADAANEVGASGWTHWRALKRRGPSKGATSLPRAVLR